MWPETWLVDKADMDHTEMFLSLLGVLGLNVCVPAHLAPTESQISTP